nr:TIGR01440 family protein [Salirhabdus euzebyi]
MVEEWISLDILERDHIFVVGCSTSEVAGERIGTAGNEEIAQVLFEELKVLQDTVGVKLAFQCCEHLNRALVVEKETMKVYNLSEVSAVPIPGAGGSMAAYAYRHMNTPVLVENIVAHAGMDIGDTFIGMHIKHVAVPIRLKQKNIGSAHVTAARTRPKLIGGERAVYKLDSPTAKTCD